MASVTISAQLRCEVADGARPHLNEDSVHKAGEQRRRSEDEADGEPDGQCHVGSPPRTLSAPGVRTSLAAGVAGPAYGVLLDEWGEEFLDHGEVELKFVGMVMDGETVDAEVAIDGDRAEVEVVNRDRERTAAVGRASRRAEPS